MRLWDAKTSGSELLNVRSMNGVDRNARLANLAHKITGTNNEILTVPINVHLLKYVVGRNQCRMMTQYSYLCIKTTADMINII